MAPSVLLYTILFTLDDLPVHKNQYIQMYLMWISCVVKTKSLNENDCCILITDKFTVSHLLHNTIFQKLIRQLNCEFQYIVNKAPKTLMEGFMWKYNTLTEQAIKPFAKDIVFYSDIDILLYSSLKQITDYMIPNSIIVHEENPFDLNYFSEGIPDDEKKVIIKHFPSVRGLSAGKFAIYGNSIMFNLFAKIQEYAIRKKDLYCHEQPLFNRAVFNTVIYDKNINLLFNLNNKCSHLKDNLNTNSPNSNIILYDCSGRPGDYAEHMERLIGTFCWFYTN
jgi:hypothetical protein